MSKYGLEQDLTYLLTAYTKQLKYSDHYRIISDAQKLKRRRQLNS
jgi:hypothetical protein